MRLHKLAILQIRTDYNLRNSISSTKNKLGSFGIEVPESLREAIASHYAYKKELRAKIKEEEKNRHLQKSHLE